jgi:hypothetical protein
MRTPGGSRQPSSAGSDSDDSPHGAETCTLSVNDSRMAPAVIEMAYHSPGRESSSEFSENPRANFNGESMGHSFDAETMAPAAATTAQQALPPWLCTPPEPAGTPQAQSKTPAPLHMLLTDTPERPSEDVTGAASHAGHWSPGSMAAGPHATLLPALGNRLAGGSMCQPASDANSGGRAPASGVWVPRAVPPPLAADAPRSMLGEPCLSTEIQVRSLTTRQTLPWCSCLHGSSPCSAGWVSVADASCAQLQILPCTPCTPLLPCDSWSIGQQHELHSTAAAVHALLDTPCR